MIANVGQHVEWDGSRGTQHGVVVTVPKPVDYDVDLVTGRAPGASVAEFGRLVGLRCSELGCQCNTSDWTHSANECQLRHPAAQSVDLTLW